MTLTADAVIENFEAATEENKMSSLREHQVVNLPADGEVWMTGDMHDHRRNFDKLLRVADLGNNPQRHLVLHELIHGDYYDATGADLSWATLHRAAELKLDFPQQVHFMLANHDLAQIHGEGIMKAGASVCEAFTKGVKNHFKDQGTGVNVAITEFLLSLPLAIRCPNGIFCCHSLPTDAQIPTFDYTIFNRPLTGPDYARKTGPVYQLIWGRHMTPAGAAHFAAAGRRQHSHHRPSTPGKRPRRQRPQPPDHRLRSQPGRFPPDRPDTRIHHGPVGRINPQICRR